MKRSMEKVETCAPSEHARRAAPRASEATVERAAALFRALGDVSRVRILEQLLDGERCVGNLAAGRALPMSTVSQQLRLLRGEGIVSRRRAGKHVFYALADDLVAAWLRRVLVEARAK